ncbi:MAG: TerC family protein [Bauldia sp.]
MNDTMTFAAQILQIVWINLLLSGDNAVVIALACRNLEGRQKTLGIALGAALAVVIRVVFTLIIATILRIPYVKLLGGLALFWIAVKLVVPSHESEDSKVTSSTSLWAAVGTVAIADVVMSLDNVLAIAAAAHGDTMLIIIGLAMSVPLVIGGSSIVMFAITKLPILVWAGAALLGWIAADMLFSDPLFEPLSHIKGLEYAAAALGAILVVATGWLIGRRRHATG